MNLADLIIPSESKILLLVMDGLGGCPRAADGKTEMEAAKIPNMDRLAKTSGLGLLDPIQPGITPGSGPAHLALFGYDPFEFEIGRGVLSALGLDLELQDGDVPARINFATIDASGKVIDRRAGRIATETNQKLVDKLKSIRIPEVEIVLKTEKEHRAAVIFRSKKMKISGRISDTDPQQTGVPTLAPKPLIPEANASAEMVAEFLRQAFAILKNDAPANAIMLRGFDEYKKIPSMADRYQLKAAAIATYPMYRGLARLVGMDIIPTGDTIASEFETLKQAWSTYNFFYLHIKKTDSYGEDGNFDGKVHIMEEVDAVLPEALKLKPDVLVITGDHCTPAVMKNHSWHPVPVLLASPYARRERASAFTEYDCAVGQLGHLPSKQMMPLMLSHALKLKKFGA